MFRSLLRNLFSFVLSLLQSLSHGSSVEEEGKPERARGTSGGRIRTDERRKAARELQHERLDRLEKERSKGRPETGGKQTKKKTEATKPDY